MMSAIRPRPCRSRIMPWSGSPLLLLASFRRKKPLPLTLGGTAWWHVASLSVSPRPRQRRFECRPSRQANFESLDPSNHAPGRVLQPLSIEWTPEGATPFLEFEKWLAPPCCSNAWLVCITNRGRIVFVGNKLALRGDILPRTGSRVLCGTKKNKVAIIVFGSWG